MISIKHSQFKNKIIIFEQGIKQKHVGKKYENESDKFSDAKIDSEDSDEDFDEDSRKGINENIMNCISSFKKQFVKPEDPLQNLQKDLVLTLNQPVEDDSKKKKKKKNTNYKRDDIKVCKQFKAKFQEDGILQQLFVEVIGCNDKENKKKKNIMKNINKFIRDHEIQEEKQVFDIKPQVSKVELTVPGSQILPISSKCDIYSTQTKLEENRQDASSAQSGSMNFLSSQNLTQTNCSGKTKCKKNSVIEKFYNNAEKKILKNLNRSAIQQRERSLTPLIMTNASGKNPNSQLTGLINHGGIYKKTQQNRLAHKVNIVGERSDPIKHLIEKINGTDQIIKTIEADKSLSVFKHSQLLNSEQNSVVFEKENSKFEEFHNMNETAYKCAQKNINNSNKNTFYMNGQGNKLNPNLPATELYKAIQALNSTSQNETNMLQNMINSISDKKECIPLNSTMENMMNQKYYQKVANQKCDYYDNTFPNKDTYQIVEIQDTSQNNHSPIKQSKQIEDLISSRTVHMPRLNMQQKNQSKSKEQITRNRSQSYRKESRMHLMKNSTNKQDLYNQIMPVQNHTEKKNIIRVKTPIQNPLKSNKTRKRESSFDLQVVPFSLQSHNINSHQGIQSSEENNASDIAFDSRPFKQYQAFQVRKNNSKQNVSNRLKNTNQ